MARVGMRRSAIYQRMRDGSFPRSRSLGSKCTVWIESEIDDWIKSVEATWKFHGSVKPWSRSASKNLS